MYFIILIIFMFCLPFSVCAEKKPLVLSLSGGGARGFAHIGVIRCFEEYGIVPDTIVGTSMGAIVGTLYSIGYSSDEIYEILKSMSSPNFFYSSAWLNKYSKNKRPKSTFTVKFDEKFNPILQGAVVSPMFLDNLLAAKVLAPQLKSGGDFDKLPIPLRIITTDVSEGKSVIHKNGDILQLVKASSAVPGFMLPVKIEENWHVDGGIKANIPLLDSTKNGDKFVVVVDVTTKEEKKEIIYSIVDALTMSITMGMKDAESRNTKLADVVIAPQFDKKIKNTDFYLFDSIIEAGYRAAKKAVENTMYLNEYKSNYEKTIVKIDDEIFVASISVDGVNEKKGRYLHRMLNAYVNEKNTAEKINNIAKFLNGSEIFEEVYFTGVEDSLVVRFREKPKLSIDIGLRFDNRNLTEILLAPQYADFLDYGVTFGGEFQIGFLRQKLLGSIFWDVPNKGKFNLSFCFDGYMSSQRLVLRQTDDTTMIINYSETDISKNGFDLTTKLGFANNVSLFGGFRNNGYRLRASGNSGSFLDFDADKNKLGMFLVGIESDYRNDGYFPTRGGTQNLQIWTSDNMFGDTSKFFTINGYSSVVIPVGRRNVIIPSIYCAWTNRELPSPVKYYISGVRYHEFISSSNVLKTVNFSGLSKMDIFADKFFVSEICLRRQVWNKYPFYMSLYANYGNLLNYDELGYTYVNKKFFYDAPVGIEVELAMQTFIGPIRFSWGRIVRGEFNGNSGIDDGNVFKFSAGFDF